MEHFCKVILYRSRLNWLVLARYNVNIAVRLIFTKNMKQTIGNRDSALGTFTFRLGDNELSPFCSRSALHTLNSLADGQDTFFKINVLPLQGANFTDAQIHIY